MKLLLETIKHSISLKFPFLFFLSKVIHSKVEKMLERKIKANV